MTDLDTLLADMRGEAALLRRAGHGGQATYLEALADQWAQATEEYRRWLSEEDAMLRSGRSRVWLRAQFPGWARLGHARLAGRRRQYRGIIVPVRAKTLEARDAGRQAGRAA